MDAHALIGVQERQVLGLPGLSDLFPIPTKGHGQATSTSATSTSASSTSASTSTSESSASASSTTSSSSSVSSSSSETSSSTSSTTEVLTSISQEPLSTATSQSTQTVTAFAVDGSGSPTSTASPAHTSFLQNKVLSGLVFALAGVVGLVVIVSILTFVIRRKRSRKLVEDAVSFDPVEMGAGYHDALEAGQSKTNYARSSTSIGHASNGPEIRQKPSFADYAPPPQMYQAQQGYNHTQQQQAYIQPFNWAAPPQRVDPYRGSRTSAEDAENPPWRSKSSSAEIQFAPPVLSPAYKIGEAR